MIQSVALMFVATLGLCSPAAVEPVTQSGELAVTWEAPKALIPGVPFDVKLELRAPEGGADVPAWALSPAAFMADGEPLAEPKGDSTLRLPSGAVLSMNFDLAPYISSKRGFSLSYSLAQSKQEPVDVMVYQKASQELNFMEMPASDLGKYQVLMQTNRGDMLMEFWPEVAPNHVRNFLDLSSSGFYENVIFHRVIPGFMIQGGDPTGMGTGSGPRNLKAEFNDRKHVRGVLSQARSQSPDSGSCQFFVMHADASHLDGQYTAFGKLIFGFEALDKIVNTPSQGTRPIDKQLILRAIVLVADA